MSAKERDGLVGRDLLRRMFEAQKCVKVDGDRFETDGTAHFELLMKGSGAPMPLGKSEAVELGEEFITAHVGESVYVLPYALVTGIKLVLRGELKRTGAGFLR